MVRVDGGVKGQDLRGVPFGVFFGQVEGVQKRVYGCEVILRTGETIKLSIGYDRAKALFTE